MKLIIHESILWLSLAVIVGMCLYLNPPAGLMVAGAGAFWITLVLRRNRS